MTDEYRPPGQDTHDTTVYGYGPIPPGGASTQSPAGALPGAPEAEYWAARFRRERERSRALLITTLAAGVLAVGLGVGAYRVATTNPSVDAASDLASGALPDPSGDANGDGLTPPAPQGGSTPDAPSDGGAAPDSGVDAQALPIPESLQGLASMLGISDVGDLLALGVERGLITEEQADQIRAGLALAGAASGPGTGSTNGSTT